MTSSLLRRVWQGPRIPAQAKKPYLDRKYTPWQHAPANWAAPGCIEYGAECIRDYAKRHGFDGIFIDGTIWVTKGYGWADKKRSNQHPNRSR